MDPKTEDELVAMYQANISINGICAELNTNPQTVYRILHGRGVAFRGRGNRQPRGLDLTAREEEMKRLMEEELKRVKNASLQEERRASIEAEVVALADGGMPAAEIAASLLIKYHQVLRMLRERGISLKRGRPQFSGMQWARARVYVREAFAAGRTDLTLTELCSETDVPAKIAMLVVRSELLRMEKLPGDAGSVIAARTPNMNEIIEEVRRRIVEEYNDAGVQLRLLMPAD